jgi:hypothetical protein
MSSRSSAGFQTEVEFTLPRGYLDTTGILHRKGVMRLATAADEILPLRDPRVQQNEAYFAVIVLARVITRLGDLPAIDVKTIEGLYASDLNFLQRLYEKLNSGDYVEPKAAEAGIATNGHNNDRATMLAGFQTVGEA